MVMVPSILDALVAVCIHNKPLQMATVPSAIKKWHLWKINISTTNVIELLVGILCMASCFCHTFSEAGFAMIASLFRWKGSCKVLESCN